MSGTSHLAGGFEWMHGVGFGPLDDDADDAPLAAARQLIEDLVTCIDVCEAMARAIDCLVCRTNEIGGEEFDRLQNLIFAIRQVHDVAHLLTGGERMSRWIAVDELVEHDDPDFGPAWPDVRRRMADVLQRAERMTNDGR